MIPYTCGYQETFLAPLPRNLALLVRPLVINYLLRFFISAMGKDMNLVENVVMPSTTRGGKDLPSRPNFSPNDASVVSSKKRNATLSDSPLSELSAHIDSNLSRASRDKEVTPDLSKSPSTNKVGSELEEIECFDDCEFEYEEDAIFARAFLYGSLEDLDKFDDYKKYLS
jgi:hypothetical protein